MIIVCSTCNKVITSAHNNKATVKYRLCFKCVRVEEKKAQVLHQKSEAQKQRLLRVLKPKGA